MNARSYKQSQSVTTNGGDDIAQQNGKYHALHATGTSLPSIVRSVHARIPTEEGDFRLYHYTNDYDGKEHLALVMGDVSGSEPVLVRVHSECFTGDVLGSRRCDCGEQLHRAMAMIAAEGRGVIVYLRQEGRGIGLAEKLRAYNLQDLGYDTVEANLLLGHQADEREYWAAAGILDDLYVGAINLLTNNPDKIEHLRDLGVRVESRVPVVGEVHADNRQYLETKAQRMRHMLDLPARAYAVFPEAVEHELDALARAIGERDGTRPFITVTYAQNLDGAIGGVNREPLAISGMESKRMTHALRTMHDAILVGSNTALADDPRLTARQYNSPALEGLHERQPRPVVLDSSMRISPDAHLFAHPRGLVIVTTEDADVAKVAAARARGAEVITVERDGKGIDLPALLDALAERGVRSLMVEGGAQVIESFLRAGLADRVIVTIAPRISNGTRVQMATAITLEQPRFTQLGEDVILWAEACAQQEGRVK